MLNSSGMARLMLETKYHARETSIMLHNGLDSIMFLFSSFPYGMVRMDFQGWRQLGLTGAGLLHQLA